ncbi:Serine/threonine-protein kinase smu1 [Coemansia sp. RSA 2702]|nr:Serine/threonine-protein kinase smu1 [Coemansia sp. RSA 2702]
MTRVLSTSEDRSVRVWDANTTACVCSVIPDADKHGLAIPPAHTIVAIPGNSNEFVVATKSPTIYIVSLDGSVRRAITADKATCNEFLAVAVTPRGKHVLAVSDMSILHYVDIETGSIQTTNNKVPLEDVIGMACHPTLNIAAFFSNDRRVPVWTA